MSGVYSILNPVCVFFMFGCHGFPEDPGERHDHGAKGMEGTGSIISEKAYFSGFGLELPLLLGAASLDLASSCVYRYY